MDVQEQLLANNDQYQIKVKLDMPSELGGLTHGRIIYLNGRKSKAELNQNLAEEIGHEKFTVGNIVHEDSNSDTQQENKARVWGMQQLVSLNALVDAWQAGACSPQEVAEELEVTPEYLLDAIEMWRTKKGLTFWHGDYYFDLTNGIQIQRYDE